MRNRITTLLAAITSIALIAGAAWAAIPAVRVDQSSLHTVDVADAGQITLALEGTWIEILSVDPNAGWTHEVETAAGREVEADFRSSGRRIQFNAELEDGELRVRIGERSGVSTVDDSTSTTVDDSTSTTVDDSTSTTVDDSTSTTVDDTTSTTVDDSTSTTVDDTTSTTIDDTTSTTIDDTTSTTIDDTTSTTIDDTTSTTVDDAPVGSGSKSYSLGVAGTVTIAWDNGIMSLVSVSVSDGWRIAEQETRSDRVKLELGNGDDEVEFEARFHDGAIRVEIDQD